MKKKGFNDGSPENRNQTEIQTENSDGAGRQCIRGELIPHHGAGDKRRNQQKFHLAGPGTPNGHYFCSPAPWCGINFPRMHCLPAPSEFSGGIRIFRTAVDETVFFHSKNLRTVDKRATKFYTQCFRNADIHRKRLFFKTKF